jgi:hypothetical protein
MLHLESDWTGLLGTRRPAQTEGYDGVFHGEFVVRKGHATDVGEYLAGQCLDFGTKTFK